MSSVSRLSATRPHRSPLFQIFVLCVAVFCHVLCTCSVHCTVYTDHVSARTIFNYEYNCHVREPHLPFVGIDLCEQSSHLIVVWLQSVCCLSALRRQPHTLPFNVIHRVWVKCDPQPFLKSCFHNMLWAACYISFFLPVLSPKENTFIKFQPVYQGIPRLQ